MALNLTLYAAFVVLVAWFWPHCAKPALIHQRANPLAYKLALGVHVGAIVVIAVASAAWLAQLEGPAKLWAPAIAATIWGLIVGLGNPRYTMLLRVTGGRLPSRVNPKL
jgi:membrane protease YdiL (CAAX protease family)